MALRLTQKDMQGYLGVTKQTKAKKCQLERIRRQRINDRLEKLKILVMKHLGNDVGFYPPMEKADILELAIRCLQEKDDNEVSSSSEKDKPPQRTPLKQLNENTQLSNIKRKLEVTPTRETFLSKSTSRVRAPFETDDNIWTPPMAIAQPRAEFKPVLNHPIKSFTKPSKENDITYLAKSHQSPRLTTSHMDSRTIQSIWRPWKL